MDKSGNDDVTDLTRHRAEKLAMSIANVIPQGTPIAIVISALSQVAGTAIAYQCGGDLKKAREALLRFSQHADDVAFIACRTLSAKGIPS